MNLFFKIYLASVLLSWLGILVSWKEVQPESDRTKIRLLIGSVLPVVNLITGLIVVDEVFSFLKKMPGVFFMLWLWIKYSGKRKQRESIWSLIKLFWKI